MRIPFTILIIAVYILTACGKSESSDSNEVQGFDLLNDINGHWVGSNQTAFGFYDWFAFDFRPISSSHSHSIYEGGTNQNIINSVFIAEVNGEQKVFARNGGWLGNQYRATYFVLDRAEQNLNEKYYRLVDAVGGKDRAYIEFRFRQDSIFFDAFKDNSGNLDQPVLHMSFKGSNRNPNYSSPSVNVFNYPQLISEVNFDNAFDNLVDPDSALFLDEASDPFPKADHGYLSDLNIEITRNAESENENLLFYISKEELVSTSGTANNNNIDNTVIRTIDIQSTEESYLVTYLHPDEYYFTVFLDLDNNGYPSSGDLSSVSIINDVEKETLGNVELELAVIIQ